MEFLQPFLDTVKNHYLDFEGRTGRRTFWMYILVYIIISLLLNALKLYTISGIFGLALFLPSISIGARRLHDIGKSGWLQLIGLIPIIGVIVLIIFWAKEGDQGDNQYGPAPQD